MEQNKFMKYAIKEAKKAINEEEIPIGAVIVKDNKVIARAYNKKEQKKDPTMHAEVIVIKKACKKIGDWRLNACSLYVTMEPCLMCTGAIIESRIKRVICGIKNEKYHEDVEKIFKDNGITVQYGILEDEALLLMKTFFINERKKQ